MFLSLHLYYTHIFDKEKRLLFLFNEIVCMLCALSQQYHILYCDMSHANVLTKAFELATTHLTV